MKIDLSPARDDSGSISVLMIGLFLLALTLSSGIINLADAYLAKRELIAILEPIVQRSVASIDLSRYYLQERPIERIPIDCDITLNRAQVEVSQVAFRNHRVEIKKIDCADDELTLVVHSEIRPLIDFPIFSNFSNGKIGVDAEAGASSIYQN
jgi:hypothetical protein